MIRDGVIAAVGRGSSTSRSPHLDGFGDSVAVMVLGAGPADVETVIVGGEVLKVGRKTRVCPRR